MKELENVAQEDRTKAVRCGVTIRIYIHIYLFIYYYLGFECSNILGSWSEVAGAPVDFFVSVCLEKTVPFTTYLLKTNASLLVEHRSGRDVLFTSEKCLRFAVGMRFVS